MSKLISFIHELTWSDIPPDIQNQARRCLIDTVGCGLSGRQTDLSRIIFDFTASQYGGTGAKLWLDGRTVSPAGAALANGMTIDSLDIHDGHPLVKGHAGAAIIPTLFATISLRKSISGEEFLTTLVMAYEVALRAGIALHATACDYHTSGAWNALACAAVVARWKNLSLEQTRHALGIAEYHGPRSQMMRCIDFPTMLKDGSGWGAMAGVSAGLMAELGFTGAPAITAEGDDVAHYWSDLGERWRINEQYIKPQAVCRWAQPAMAAALHLQKTHQISSADIEQIQVHTFHQGVRLAVYEPQDTEQAQYSLPFPVAAVLVHGRLGGRELNSENLRHPEVLALSHKIELVENDVYNGRFPAQRFAHVNITTTDGRKYHSGEFEAGWDAHDAPTDEQMLEKFRWLAGDILPSERANQLEEALWNCAKLNDVSQLAEALALPK